MDFRNYDAQIGRFVAIDLLAELNYNWSPYAFAQDNPILFSDPNGLDTISSKKLPDNYSPKPGDVWINGGTTSIYDQDRGWTAQVQLQGVVVGNSESSSDMSSTIGYLSLFTEAYKHSGQLQHPIQILESGKFQAWFNGESKIWKMGFRGNPSVSSSLVTIQKENFLRIVRANAKLLEYLKRTTLVLNVADGLLTLNRIRKEGLTLENGTDLAFNIIAFLPGGWVVSGIYFLGKETGIISWDDRIGKHFLNEVFGEGPGTNRKEFMNTVGGVSR